MIFQQLNWDTEFFGHKVYSLHIEEAEEAKRIRTVLASSDFDVCYVFSRDYSSEIMSILQEHGGILFDKKTTYMKNLNSEATIQVNEHVHEIRQADDSTISLAVQSGWKSRFYLDPKFNSFQPELYKRWLLRDIESSKSKVFGFYREDELAGLACTSLSGENEGNLDLIAVSDKWRKLGIGRVLLNYVENYWIKNGKTKGKIVTQMENEAACRFYESNKYILHDMQYVWHIWRS